jgi:hypothetical protein
MNALMPDGAPVEITAYLTRGVGPVLILYMPEEVVIEVRGNKLCLLGWKLSSAPDPRGEGPPADHNNGS